MIETEAVACHIVPRQAYFLLEINANTISRVEWKHRVYKIDHRNIYFTNIYKWYLKMPKEVDKEKKLYLAIKILAKPDFVHSYIMRLPKKLLETVVLSAMFLLSKYILTRKHWYISSYKCVVFFFLPPLKFAMFQICWFFPDIL